MIDKRTNMRTKEESTKVAIRRTESLLKQLKLLGNLSNSYYDLSDDQLADIIRALDNGFKETKNKLKNRTNISNNDKLFNPKW